MIDQTLKRLTTDVVNMQATLNMLVFKIDKLSDNFHTTAEPPAPATISNLVPKIDEYEKFVKRNDAWVTIQAAALLSDMTENYMSVRLLKGKVRHSKIGRRKLYLASDIEEFFKCKISESLKNRKFNSKMRKYEIASYLFLHQHTIYESKPEIANMTTKEQVDRYLLSIMETPE